MAQAILLEPTNSTDKFLIPVSSILTATPQGTGSKVTYVNGTTREVKEDPAAMEALANA